MSLHIWCVFQYVAWHRKACAYGAERMYFDRTGIITELKVTFSFKVTERHRNSLLTLFFQQGNYNWRIRKKNLLGRLACCEMVSASAATCRNPSHLQSSVWLNSRSCRKCKLMVKSWLYRRPWKCSDMKKERVKLLLRFAQKDSLHHSFMPFCLISRQWRNSLMCLLLFTNGLKVLRLVLFSSWKQKYLVKHRVKTTSLRTIA